MTAMTLYEIAKLKDPTTAAFIEIFADNTVLSRWIRYMTVPSGLWKYNIEEALPEVAFRGLNEGYTSSIGLINPQVEETKAVGGLIEVDHKMRREQGQVAVDRHKNMKLKSMAIEYSKAFMKGSATASANRTFDGLQTRLTGRQLVPNVPGGTGDPLSLNRLDEAISLVDSPDVIFCNRQMVNRFSQAMRDQAVAGNINFVPNTGPGALQGFGQRIMTYDGIPVVEFDEDQQRDQILKFDEAAEGGGTTSTSIYVCSFQPGNIDGFQSDDPIVVEDADNGQPTIEATLFDWFTGLAIENPRGAARISGVTNAAIVK